MLELSAIGVDYDPLRSSATIWAAWCESRGFMGLPTGSPFRPLPPPLLAVTTLV